jgi:hypothetical protein
MNWTPFFITFIVITITIYDLIVVVFFGTQRSVSRFVSVVFYRAPAVTFGCGFLCGHFCGQMLPMTDEDVKQNIPAIVKGAEHETKLPAVDRQTLPN